MPTFPEDKARRDQLARQFGAHADKHWSTLSLYRRVHDVEKELPQDREGELRYRYTMANRLSNLLLHGAPMTLNDRIEQVGFDVAIQAGPSIQHLAPSLEQAYWSYWRLVRLLCETVVKGESLADVDAIHEEGWPILQVITVASLKHVTRNGLCPCGSASKAKDCHWAV
jgi:hypothetical protein